MQFVWDLNNTPGVYIEFRLDGSIRLYGDILTLQLYAQLCAVHGGACCPHNRRFRFLRRKN